MKSIYVMLMVISILALQGTMAGQTKTSCSELEFGESIHDWYHIARDETFTDSTCTWSDGQSHFYWLGFRYIEANGYLYLSYPVYIKYNEVEGALIEKIEISTGKKIWQSTFDLRTDTTQETVAYMRVEDNKLEVYSYRRINQVRESWFPFILTRSGIEPCILTVRKFNIETSDLITYDAPENIDNGLYYLYNQSEEGGYTYARNFDDSLYMSFVRSTKDIKMTLVNKKTGKVYESYRDTVKVGKPYNDSIYFVQGRLKTLILSRDTIVVLNQLNNPKKLDSLDHQSTIILYNYKLERVKEVDIERHVGNFVSQNLEYADSRYIIISANRRKTPFDTIFTEYLVFDWDGNLLHDTKVAFGKNYYVFLTIQPLEAYGEFLLIGRPRLSSAMDFLHISREGKLTLRRSIPFYTERYAVPYNILHYSANDIILRFGSGTRNPEGYTDTDCLYNFIKIDLEKIGYYTPVTETETDTEPMIYPNPGQGSYTISLYGISTPADLRIFDMAGRNVYVQSGLHDGDNTIDLTDLPSGTYIYKLYQGSRQIGQGQVVRM